MKREHMTGLEKVGDSIRYTISELNKGGEWVQVQVTGTVVEVTDEHIKTDLGIKLFKTLI